MNVFEFFRKNEIDTVHSSFFREIEKWRSWYKGDVKTFHHYKVHNGNGYIKCKRRSLQMAKKVCEDIADLLLNEKVSITLTDEITQEFVDRVLKDNDFWTVGNEYQERKAATGTVAYVAILNNAAVDDEGHILRGDVEINYVEASNIYPLSWRNNKITECAFMFSHTIKQKKYAQFQFHQIEAVSGERQYVITNRVVLCSSGAGEEIPPELWGRLPPFADLSPRIETGTEEPQFVIDRLNIVNNIDDESNPMGISIFANSIPTLEKIDLEYDSYANEYELGKKRIFVKGEAMNYINGNTYFDPNDVVFHQLPTDTEFGEKSGRMIEESNMEIRAEAHSKGINDDLNFLSFKCGYGTERYKFEKGTVTTATQVISENSDMYRTIKKHELILDDVLKELVHIIIRLGATAGNKGLNEEAEVTIDFDDSIIEDKQTERQEDRNDVAMGVMRHEEYRAKWYGETTEKAAENLPEQNAVMDDEVRIQKKSAEP